MNTDFGIRDLREIEQDELVRIVLIQFFFNVMFFMNVKAEEPSCGIPMKEWVQSYLFFKMVNNLHDGIGCYLRLSNRPFEYKSWHKYVIYTTFHLFEFWWVVYGEYLFFFTKFNICVRD